MNSRARTIGPATRCGKKLRYSAKSIVLAGSSRPLRRWTSTTYEIAWKTMKLMPTGSAIAASGSGRPSPALSRTALISSAKKP